MVTRLVGIVAVAALLTGCGSGSSQHSTTTASTEPVTTLAGRLVAVYHASPADAARAQQVIAANARIRGRTADVLDGLEAHSLALTRAASGPMQAAITTAQQTVSAMAPGALQDTFGRIVNDEATVSLKLKAIYDYFAHGGKPHTQQLGRLVTAAQQAGQNQRTAEQAALDAWTRGLTGPQRDAVYAEIDKLQGLDSCTVVSRAEAGRALGERVGAPVRGNATVGTGAACVFYGPHAPAGASPDTPVADSVRVVLVSGPTAPVQYNGYRAKVAAQPVGGLGSPAFFDGGRSLSVLVGDEYVRVAVIGVADVLGAEKQLAAAVLQRL